MSFTATDILPNDQFVSQRQKMLSDVIAAKKARALYLGDAFYFLFENTTTMRWQVQEMCRVENITDSKGVAHEVETYSALTTRPDSLAATLLLQWSEPAVRDVWLKKLVGLHEHLFLEVDGVGRVAVQFDEAQFEEGRISGVQFVRIPVSDAMREALGRLDVGARMVCTHPEYTGSVDLPATLRGALIEDLAAN